MAMIMYHILAELLNFCLLIYSGIFLSKLLKAIYEISFLNFPKDYPSDIHEINRETKHLEYCFL